MNLLCLLRHLFVSLAFVIGWASPSSAQSGDRWEASLEHAGFYDSQLTVEAADISQVDGDIGLKLGANIVFKPVDTKTTNVEVGYKLGQTLYSEFSEFDLQTHRVNASITRTIGNVRIGAQADATNIRLANNQFMDLVSASPSVGIFLREDVYMRGHVRIAEKRFAELEQRDASVHQAGASLFRFHKGGRGYMQANVRLERENAVDPALDFDGMSGSLALKLPLANDRDALSIKFSTDYRSRNYDAVNPSIGEARSETRIRAGAEIELKLTQKLSADLAYRYTDRNSNFRSADYFEHRAALGFTLRL